MSHQHVRHYQAARAHSIGERLGDKLRRLLRARPAQQDEARRRIDPMEPFGAWAAGWEPAAYPNKKAPAAAATADQGHRQKITIIIPQRPEKIKGDCENA